MKTYAIIVSGDSYYRNRIKRESHGALLSDEMHHCAGLLGMYEGHNVGTSKEVKKLLASYAFECEAELSHDKKSFEDNLVYYEILSRSEIKEKYDIDILK